MSYEEYRRLVVELVEQGRCTGNEQTEELFEFSKLNIQRMKRIGKTYVPNLNGLKGASLSDKFVFLTITEGWCGDAAQALPVIARIADELQIEHRYALRDDNPELIDQHLSDGTRSIPILLVIDKSSFEPVGKWGSRPAGADQIMADWKALPEPKISKEEVKTQIQIWYNKDKQVSIETEIAAVLNRL